ncbi:signal transducer and activator of transcription 5B-like isoform X1 [Argonauta hians]
MSLWMKTRQLPEQYWSPIFTCYQDSNFPVEVREVMSDWIEQQNWDAIDENNMLNENAARNILNEFLQEMEIRYQNLSQENFCIKLKLSQAQQDFQHLYGDHPLALVHTIKKCLDIEKNYINMNEGNVEVAHDFYEKFRVLDILEKNTKDSASFLQQIQEIQGNFTVEFQEFQTRKEIFDASQKDGNKSPTPENLKEMQSKLIRRSETVKDLHRDLINKYQELSKLHYKTNDQLNELTMTILHEDLVKWKRNQQQSGNTTELEDNLREIHKRCSMLATLIWENRQQIRMANQLYQRFTQKLLYTDLEIAITKLLSRVVTDTFLVQQQPTQILKKDAGRFSAVVTLLVGRALNVNMDLPDVQALLISEQQARQIEKDQFDTKETMGEIVNSVSKMELVDNNFLSANFRNMQLKKIKRTERKAAEAVTEEKFAILFKTKFKVGSEDLSFCIWTLSNPVVVTVHGNQECKAMATILWDNHFATLGRVLFTVPDSVEWSHCADMLSDKFRTDIGVPLTHENTNYLATKLFDGSPDEDYSRRVLTWNQFCKDCMREKSFTFWDWFYAIVKLTKEHLLAFYQQGLIAGFIAKDQAQQMLLSKRPGTFLLRFSDNKLGGVTIAWMQCKAGKSQVFNVSPYSSKDLNTRSLVRRIHDLEGLVYLYPDSMKYDVFPKARDEDDESDTLVQHGYVASSLVDSVPIMEDNSKQEDLMDFEISRQNSPYGQTDLCQGPMLGGFNFDDMNMLFTLDGVDQF